MSMEKVLEFIKEHYNGAVPDREVIERIIVPNLSEKGYSPKDVVCGVSLCRDDSTTDFDHALKDAGFARFFGLNTLSGIPLYGPVALGAKYHHYFNSDNNHRPGLIIYGPHIGINSEGDVGYLDREGRGSCKDKSCGANHGLIGIWKNGSSIDMDENYEFAGLDRFMSVKRSDVLNSENSLKTLVESEYDVGLSMLKDYVKKVQGSESDKHPIMVVAGIHIDTPYEKEVRGNHMPNHFQVREVLWINDGKEYKL